MQNAGRNAKRESEAVKTYDETKRLIWETCRRLADQAFAEYSRQISPQLYLCGRKNDAGAFVEIGLYRDECDPDGFMLVLSEPISRSMTTDAVTMWLHEQLRREPVLPAIVPENYAA